MFLFFNLKVAVPNAALALAVKLLFEVHKLLEAEKQQADAAIIFYPLEEQKAATVHAPPG